MNGVSAPDQLIQWRSRPAIKSWSTSITSDGNAKNKHKLSRTRTVMTTHQIVMSAHQNEMITWRNRWWVPKLTTMSVCHLRNAKIKMRAVNKIFRQRVWWLTMMEMRCSTPGVFQWLRTVSISVWGRWYDRNLRMHGCCDFCQLFQHNLSIVQPIQSTNWYINDAGAVAKSLQLLDKDLKIACDCSLLDLTSWSLSIAIC